MWDIWSCKFRMGSAVFRGECETNILSSCRSTMIYCSFIAKLFMETLYQISNCFVCSFQQPGFSILSVNSTIGSSRLTCITDHSMFTAASPVEKVFCRIQENHDYKGVKCNWTSENWNETPLLASYRIWLMITSFEDSWNFLKSRRFIESYYPGSANTP